MSATLSLPGEMDAAAVPLVAGGNWVAVRIYAVLMVLYGNGFLLTGGLGRGLWGLPFEQAGLAVLFSISGYLIGGSLSKTDDIKRFVVRRFARLFPGLLVSVVVTMLVIGALATKLPLRHYLRSHLMMVYIENAVLIPRFYLPAVFTGQEWNGAVNPMLRTLLPGVLGCGGVALLWRAPAKMRPWVLAGVGLLCGTAGFWMASAGLYQGGGWSAKLAPTLAMLAFFLISAAIRAFEGAAPGLLRADIAILCFGANWTIAAWIGPATTPLLWVTIPYMVAAFGQLSGPVLTRLAVAGNPSYGMYLYGFPLQQLIVARLPHLAHPVVVCTVATVLIGYLSWHLVEQPALAYARRRWPPGHSVAAGDAAGA